MSDWVEVEEEVCIYQVDLMDTLGTADLMPHKGAMIRMRDCLCAVDLNATAAKHGYKLERVTGSAHKADWRMVPVDTPAAPAHEDRA